MYIKITRAILNPKYVYLSIYEPIYESMNLSI